MELHLACHLMKKQPKLRTFAVPNDKGLTWFAKPFHTRDLWVHRKDFHIILWLTFAMTVQARQLSIFKFDWLLLYIKKISGSHRYLTYFILKYLHIFTLIRIYKKLKNYYKLKKLRKKLKVKKTKCVQLDCVILTF